MYVSQLIKSIRSQYVGTAAEHALLASLETDATTLESEIGKRLEDEAARRQEQLDLAIERCQWIKSASRIDEAVFYLHRDIKTNYGLDHALDEVAFAMKTRGLTRDLVLKIAEKME